MLQYFDIYIIGCINNTDLIPYHIIIVYYWFDINVGNAEGFAIVMDLRWKLMHNINRECVYNHIVTKSDVNV